MSLSLMVLVLLTGVVALSGCASTWTPNGITKNTTRPFRINVTSEPNKADIYFNDMLIGQTPVESLPIAVPSTYTSWGLGLPQSLPKGQCYLRVSKKGYGDSVKPLEYNIIHQPGANTVFNLKEYDYHFVLEKD